MKKQQLKVGLGDDFKATPSAQETRTRAPDAKRHILPLLAIPVACGLAYFGTLEFAAFWLSVTISALYFAAAVERGD